MLNMSLAMRVFCPSTQSGNYNKAIYCLVITTFFINRGKVFVVGLIREESNESERICPAVTKADTNHSLNLSTVFKYILLDSHMFSSTKSRAACAMNWFK